MDKYEQITVVGEGSYGVVMKCRHKESDQIVAVKKFLETEEDATVRRMALREIRMLKKLKHENLITMIEVFRHRKRFYLVFEYLEGTVLDELEKMQGGLGDERSRERIYQVIRGIHYIHSNNIVHRDVKPENILVSSQGIVKLCDFGFARLVGAPGEACTEYVATRWYRAPELLVGEMHYGAPVDIWAIGCLYAEMMTGEPLFPGESDIDQLYLIVKLIGKPCTRHQQLMNKSSHMRGMKRSAATDTSGLYKAFPNWSLIALDFLIACMKMDPNYRPTAEELLKHNYFTNDHFPQRFLPALRDKVRQEFNNNPLIRKYKAEVFASTDALSARDTDYHHQSIAKSKRGTGSTLVSMDTGPRWKMQFSTEGSVKRKYSYENVSVDGDRASRASMVKDAKFAYKSNQSLSKQGSLQSQQSGNNRNANQPIIKINPSYTLSNSKLQQHNDNVATLTGMKNSLNSLRSNNMANAQQQNMNFSVIEATCNGEPLLDVQQSSGNICPSLVRDSVQSNLSQRQPEGTGGSRSISNSKKNSPANNMIHCVQQSTVRSNINQVPLNNPLALGTLRAQQVNSKKLDKIATDVFLTLETNSTGGSLCGDRQPITNSLWYNSLGHKKREGGCWKSRDDFTLPNVPGATGSPNHRRHKTQASPDALPAFYTPRMQSSPNSQKSTPSQMM